MKTGRPVVSIIGKAEEVIQGSESDQKLSERRIG
jgi:hypothetical protein